MDEIGNLESGIICSSHSHVSVLKSKFRLSR